MMFIHISPRILYTKCSAILKTIRHCRETVCVCVCVCVERWHECELSKTSENMFVDIDAAVYEF